MVLWHAPAPARASLVPASACCPLSPDGTARSLAPAAPAALVPRGQGTPLPHTRLLWSKIPLESAGNSLAWGLDSSLEGPACPNGFLGLCEVLGHRSVLAAGGPRAGGGWQGRLAHPAQPQRAQLSPSPTRAALAEQLPAAAPISHRQPEMSKSLSRAAAGPAAAHRGRTRPSAVGCSGGDGCSSHLCRQLRTELLAVALPTSLGSAALPAGKDSSAAPSRALL